MKCHGCLIMSKEVVKNDLFLFGQTVVSGDMKRYPELGDHYSCFGKTEEELRINQDIFTTIKQIKIRPALGGTEQ